MEALHIVRLDYSDTFYSIRDTVLQSPARRMALLLPPGSDVLRQGVDLVLLRRLADQNRLEIGVVTTDHILSREAGDLGFPVFESLHVAERGGGRWSTASARFRVGLGPSARHVEQA